MATSMEHRVRHNRLMRQRSSIATKLLERSGGTIMKLCDDEMKRMVDSGSPVCTKTIARLSDIKAAIINFDTYYREHKDE